MNYKAKPANQHEISLYCLIGEAVCHIQNLEGTLSTLITLKMDVKSPDRIPKKEADILRGKNYRLTLGEAIEKAKESNLYSDSLYNDLKAIQKDRNWLIHKLAHENSDAIGATATRERLFQRIKSISNKANLLQFALEADLIQFSESVGVDMSRVRAYIEKYNGVSPS